jgi:hypothetical protein
VPEKKILCQDNKQIPVYWPGYKKSDNSDYGAQLEINVAIN